MTEAEIEIIIIETLRGLQAGTGEPECDMTPATAPLAELGFFDSLLAIETTLVLEERLGCSCGEDSVFRDKNKPEPLTIAEIATRLAQLTPAAA